MMQTVIITFIEYCRIQTCLDALAAPSTSCAIKLGGSTYVRPTAALFCSEDHIGLFGHRDYVATEAALRHDLASISLQYGHLTASNIIKVIIGVLLAWKGDDDADYLSCSASMRAYMHDEELG